MPSCVIVMIIAKVYLKYRKMGMLQGILNALRPAVIAMIASAGISILITAFWGTAVIKLINTNWSLVIIFVICFALLQKLKMNPIGVMVLAGIMKLGLSLIKNDSRMPLGILESVNSVSVFAGALFKNGNRFFIWCRSKFCNNNSYYKASKESRNNFKDTRGSGHTS